MAQFSLGVAYADGRGVAQDAGEAVAWYRRAAEQGHAVAQFTLGLSYDNGDGVAQNAGEAVVWYRRAAEQGHADARFTLGGMYLDGRGVAQNAAVKRWCGIGGRRSRRTGPCLDAQVQARGYV